LALSDLVAQTVAGLGYDMVELERTPGGILRVTIDWPWDGSERSVNVEDCERVTRQLQYTLEVEEVDYQRLEVSSPGIDRPLRHEKDFERFVGEVVDITLKAPIGAAAGGEPEPVPGKKVSKKKEPAPLRAMGFTLDETKEVRLAPIVDFKGRKRAGVQEQGK
jgi:ribosome maturation factor RimP